MSKTESKKKRPKLGALRIVLIVLCVGVAGFSGYKLIGILHEYKQGSDTYNQVEEDVFKPAKHEEYTEEGSESLIPEIDFDALKAISNNAVAWLYNPGTVINYPVAKTKDNSYYLDHMIDGTYNSNGCLFVDYRNADGWTDPNTVIYGHRMKNGKMLSSIANYSKQEYYDEHPVMYFLTPDGAYELQIFSAYTTQSTSDAYRRTFGSGNEFQAWLNNTVKRSYIKTDVKVTPEDRVITLSTCVKADDSRRFVVIGKLVKLELEP